MEAAGGKSGVSREAARLRDRIRAIQKVGATQAGAALDENRSMDVWGFVKNHLMACCVVLKFREGRLSDKENFVFDEVYDLTDVRDEFMTRYYANTQDFPKAVVLDEEVEDMELFQQFLRHRSLHAITAAVPQKGERKKLVEMAYNNAVEQLSLKVQRTGREVAALEELGQAPGTFQALLLYRSLRYLKLGGDCPGRRA